MGKWQVQYYRQPDSLPVPISDFKRSSCEHQISRLVLGLSYFWFTRLNTMTYLVILPQKSSYKYKYTYLHHKINILEYKVFSKWTVIEASSRRLALQVHNHFQTFLLLYLYFFSIFIPFPVQTTNKTKEFSRKTDKRYAWRVSTSCRTGSHDILININMNLLLVLKTDRVHNYFWGREKPGMMCFKKWGESSIHSKTRV